MNKEEMTQIFQERLDLFTRTMKKYTDRQTKIECLARIEEIKLLAERIGIILEEDKCIVEGD